MSNPTARVAISGVGYSERGRRLPYSSDELVRQAVAAALDDAGMTTADIDGIAISGGLALGVGQLLGIMPLNWFFTSSQIGPAFSEPAVMTMSAVASGMCHTAVALRLMRQEGGGRPRPTLGAMDMTPPPPDSPRMVSGDAQWTAPFGGSLPASFLGALQMQRYMSQYSAKEEHFALNATIQRDYATRNPEAILRVPLTIDEYLESRFVSKPVRLLDCDYPCDGATAVIFTTRERARNFRRPPVLVESWAMSAVHDIDMTLLDDFVGNSVVHCSDAIWSRTDLGPGDVDTAHLYDGFSIMTFEWLEGLGFCGPGEAGPFIADGNTRVDGLLPLNTDGGACNMGRLHGGNFCVEAVRQIRGECGDRQMPDAEVSVWSNASGSFAGAALLTADR
jgi:acetyl-CoA acetyltransferase